MNFDGEMRVIDLTPEQSLLDFDYTSIDWEKEKYKGPPGEHSLTRRIGFIRWKDYYEGMMVEPTIETYLDNQDCPVFSMAMIEIAKLEKVLNAKAKGAALIGLLPHSTIPMHIDISPIYHVAHRCHLSLVTSPNVIYKVNDTDYTMERGTWYEINNRLPHTVINTSDIFRINLLVDLLPL